MPGMDPVELAARLIACRSVTPEDGGALDVAGLALASLGFAVERLESGGAPSGPVANLIATRGTGGPHLLLAGHTDVVPAGLWPDAFAPRIDRGALHGRGAVDMKGAVACFLAAAARVPADAPGTLTIVLTGDEEGPAVHGTAAIIERMAARGLRPDACLVGEPTSERRLGDTIKIGRRGSVNVWIEVGGTQGHVAYPQLADNPVPRLVRALARLGALRLDEGTDWFQPSNLEVTDVTVGNPATNVIPAAASARLNIRFNDRQRGADLVALVARLVEQEAPGARLRHQISGEAFLTPPGAWTALVAGAVAAETGAVPSLSTGGGTSDARFLSRLCPTVELGLLNTTMHKVDEAVPLADLHALTAIYARVVAAALGQAKG